MNKKLKITLVRFPKCASTFLHNNFSTLLKEGKISDYRFVAGLAAGPSKKLIYYRSGNQTLSEPESSPLPLEAPERREWRFISCIRHPVERFFSALFFNEAALVTRKHSSLHERTSLEAKIKLFIESGELKPCVFELMCSGAPGCYFNHMSLLTSMDILIFQEHIQEGIDKIKQKWNFDIINKIHGKQSTDLYNETFNKDCGQERQLLKEKYYGPLEQIFQKDIEAYHSLKNKFL